MNDMSAPTASQLQELPGGGSIRVLCSRSGIDGRSLHILEQERDHGQVFRWLCSLCPATDGRSHLIAETLVELALRRTRRPCFSRAMLLPEYHRAMVAALGIRTQPFERALFLGTGGAALPMHLAAHYPHCTMTLVETCAATLDLAFNFFGCPRRGPRWRTHHCSAEEFISCRRFAGSRRKGFDAILLDASSAAGTAPPPSLAKHETFCRLRALLRPGGSLVVNLLGDPVAHMAPTTAAFETAFQPCDTLKRLYTTEGNIVLIAVTSVVDDCGEQIEMRGACNRLECWVAVCKELGLTVDSCR